MSNLVHKFQDVETGDVVTLKSGGPEMTVVAFVPADAVPVPAGIQNASYREASLKVHVMGVASDGSIVQTTVPLEALNLKAKTGDESGKPKDDHLGLG